MASYLLSFLDTGSPQDDQQTARTPIASKSPSLVPSPVPELVDNQKKLAQVVLELESKLAEKDSEIAELVVEKEALIQKLGDLQKEVLILQRDNAFERSKHIRVERVLESALLREQTNKKA
jgi:uncharacterized membrane protein